MTTNTIAPAGAVSNRVQRRALFGGVALVACTAAAAARQNPPAADPGAFASVVASMAHRVARILERENELDEKGLSNLLPSEMAEEDALFEERGALSDAVVGTTPINAGEALLVMLHAVDRIRLGCGLENGTGMIEAGERSVGRCLAVLAREMAFDLRPFGSDVLLPERLYPISAGRA